MNEHYILKMQVAYQLEHPQNKCLMLVVLDVP